MTEEILLTKEGYDKIVEEHEELVAVRRAEVAEKLKEAIAQGDISENADYDAAKNEQAELEERIQKLENMIRKAKIIDESELAGDQVTVGLTVKVQDMDTKEEEEFTIVGSTEADPFEGRISNESLVGQALLGKKAGEEVAVEVPDGMINYKRIEISKEETRGKMCIRDRKHIEHLLRDAGCRTWTIRERSSDILADVAAEDGTAQTACMGTKLVISGTGSPL